VLLPLVLDKKFDADGNLSKFKARYVAQGFSQIEGIHFTETFAPTLNPNTFRLFLAHSVLKCNMNLNAMDVNTAFLIPSLPDSEMLYMKPPPNFIKLCKLCDIPYISGQVLQLNKCIYGLKQASRYWNEMFSNALSQLGFESLTHVDPCCFINRKTNCVIVIHVDDLAITAPVISSINSVKSKLMKRFKMKDLGRPRIWTGINIEYFDNYLKISQPLYVGKILETFKMTNCTSSCSPTSTEKLVLDGVTLHPSIPYRAAVGSLLWLVTCTRPDIAFAVGQVARYSHKPTVSHWKAVLQILKYLKGTQYDGIIFEYSDDIVITGYSDADWSGSENRRSTGGYFWFINSTIVSWKCSTRKCICLSSLEAETVFMSLAAQEAVFLSRLAISLNLINNDDLPLTLFGDNQGAISAAKNHRVSSRTKHIAIRDLFIRDMVTKGLIVLVWLSTKEMVADLLTKCLGPTRFLYLKSLLKMK
jgi:hypothetical protein